MKKICITKKAAIITACITIPTAIVAFIAPKLLKNAKCNRYTSTNFN